MSEKQVRTLEIVQQETMNLCAKIGALTFQKDEEIPTQLTKLFNQMIDLSKEGERLFRERQEMMEKATEIKLPEEPALKVVETEPAASV